MNNLLQKAIRLNRRLTEEGSNHLFWIANSVEEEDRFLEDATTNDLLVILRLYEKD